MSALSHDKDAFRRELAKCDPRFGDFATKIAGLIEAIQERGRLAESAGGPAEKVEHLEYAKWGLAQLEDLTAGVNGMQVVGLEEARALFDRLEATYRAFGYYRTAGLE